MKLITDDEMNAMYSRVLRGGAYGAVVGFIGSMAFSLVAQRYWRGYRNLTLPLKAMFVTGGTSAYTVIEAERAMNDFAAEQYAVREKSEVPLEQILHGEDALKEAMMKEVRDTKPILDRALDFVREYRWSVVGKHSCDA
jgi:hypothetical protein